MLAVDDTQRRSGVKTHWFWGGLMFLPARTSTYGTNKNCKPRLRELGRWWTTYVISIFGHLKPIKICAVPRSNTREWRSSKPSLLFQSMEWLTRRLRGQSNWWSTGMAPWTKWAWCSRYYPKPNVSKSTVDIILWRCRLTLSVTNKLLAPWIWTLRVTGPRIGGLRVKIWPRVNVRLELVVVEGMRTALGGTESLPGLVSTSWSTLSCGVLMM